MRKNKMYIDKITNLDQLKRHFDRFCSELEGKLSGSQMIIDTKSVNIEWFPSTKSDILELESLRDYADNITLTIKLTNYGG
jgi:hypothetical protein